MEAANPLQSLQEEATCPICLEYFTDPVTTKCGHNFCRPCVSACSGGAGTALSCPQCRAVCPLGDLRANRQLQSIVELVKQLSAQQERPPGEGLTPGEGLCAVHKESLKLFCKEDEKLICVTCWESKEHTAHTVRPIKKAAQEYKPKLQEWLQTLRGELEAAQRGKLKAEEDCKAMRNKKRKMVQAFQRLQQPLKKQEQTLLRRLEEMDKKIAIIKKAKIAKLSAEISSLQALITEIEKKCKQPSEELLKNKKRKMVQAFQRLQQLLKKQEQTLLRRLEKTDKKIAIIKKAKIAKLSAEISSLQALITEIEKKCEQPSEKLLKDIRSTLDRCEHAMDQQPGREIKKYKVRVMLDEDTASDWLALSEGGRRVRHTDTRQDRPDTPKRFTNCSCVLGREGFTAGRHYWELQLLRDGGWAVGVARESVNRKGEATLSPEGGVWAMFGYKGQYVAFTSSQTLLTPSQRSVKLGVYLDYEGGQLSVYNADTMGALCTFTGAAFRGRVCPFFWVYGSAELRLV